MWRYISLVSISVVVLTSLSAAKQGQQPLKRYTFSEVHMGTEFQIIFYAPDDKVATKAAKAAFARVRELDHIMSDYKKTSELMQLCQKAGKGPVKVSKELFEVLSRAQELSKQTDGAFDVTIGPVVRLWRKARKLRRLPDPDQLKAALAKVGYTKLELDPIMQTVRLLIMEMLLDLGGIAKGFAANAVLEVLRPFGIDRALVAASGDIAVSGPPPKKKGWIIGIGPLKNPNKPPKHYVRLKHAAVSTSGDVEQFVVIDGKRYSHIVNPKTGIGLLGRSSVTVIAKDCTTTDSVATAVSVLGPKKGLELIESIKGAATLIVRETKNGTLESIKSKRFAQYEYTKEKPL